MSSSKLRLFIFNKAKFVFLTNLTTNNLPDGKRQQTTTVDNKRLITGLVLTDGFLLRHENGIVKNKKPDYLENFRIKMSQNKQDHGQIDG